MQDLSALFARVLRKVIEPAGQTPEGRRQEYTTNVLLCGLACITLLLLLFSSLHYLDLQVDRQEDMSILYGTFLLVVTCLWRLSKLGYHQTAGLGMLAALYVAAIKLTLHWSFELPFADLLYAVIVVFAGILLDSHAALLVAAGAAGTLMGIGYAQTTHHVQPRLDWLSQDFQMGDIVGCVVVLSLLALVSWLTNRDVNRSLQRAHASEVALSQERDCLERTVMARTRELESAQRLRVLELERFAEFGRLSACLVHEIANPLTAASLNLGQLNDIDSPLVLHTRRSLQQMERYVRAARRQLNSQSAIGNFSVHDELTSVGHIMRPLARQAGVNLIIKKCSGYKLYGDPVKFSHLVANLTANALDAYDGSPRTAIQQVCVAITQTDTWLNVRVQDWGKGIGPAQLPYIFKPFYTSKAARNRGTGIGLSTVKRIVENDFGGRISVVSTPGEGTCFTARLRRVSA